jgi:signal transduction histidine kinase
VIADRKFVHDMKNMLGIVIGYSNLLLEDLPQGDPKREDVNEIRKAAEGALSLLESAAGAADGARKGRA